jgi:hypothetical protein
MSNSNRQSAQPKTFKPTVEDFAEALAAPDEYLWATRRRQAWGWATLLMLLAVLMALTAVAYIGGRQAYVFSGYGAPSTHALRAYFAAHSAAGITLAQSAPAVPHDWVRLLADGLQRCWAAPRCRAALTGTQWDIWRTNAGAWFPQLVWAVEALQAFLGALALALLTYLIAIFDVRGWQRWEQRQRLAAGKVERDRQRRGG